MELKHGSNTLPRGGMYWKIRPPEAILPRGPRDCPRATSRAEGCKLPQGAYIPICLDPRQCSAIIFSREGVYWKLPLKQPGCNDYKKGWNWYLHGLTDILSKNTFFFFFDFTDFLGNNFGFLAVQDSPIDDIVTQSSYDLRLFYMLTASKTKKNPQTLR